MTAAAGRVAWWRLAAAAGPGLVVMLANTEAGSVITAAQSGAKWGYTLLLPQFALIAPLIMTQELAARLGIGTRQGLAALVLRRAGRPAAVLLLAALGLSCGGALLTQFAGLAGVGESFGVPEWQAVAVAVAALLALLWTGSYRRVERIALAVGACELAFLALAWFARPDPAQIAAEMFRLPLGNRSYLYLLAANLGTGLMPWSVFDQQSASVDKGLTRADLGAARLETVLGAVLCQGVTAAVLVAAAARLRGAAGELLASVGQIADAFTASLGPAAGRAVFALGLGGGALVASIVVCLTAAWGVEEVFGMRHAAPEGPRRAPWFYAVVTASLLSAGAVAASGVDLVRLSLAAAVLNAALLPLVLAALLALARRALPAELRLRGGYAAAVGIVLSLAAALGFGAGLVGAW